MKIGIIPTIREIYKNQFELTIDINLINFIKSIFTKSEVIILNNKKERFDYNLIVISGGNNLINLDKKKDVIRQKLTKHFFKISINENIPILGICYGAQFLAKSFNSKIGSKKHVGKHKIYINKLKKKILVNSFHNDVILKLGKNLVKLAEAEDGTIESFKHKDKKILGIMWHPERNKSISSFDKKIIKSVLCN